MQSYLDVTKAADLKNPRDRLLYRFFEILPGALSLSTLGFSVLFSWWKPSWVAVFVILFCLYWTLKVIYISFYQILSFRRMKRYLKINWREKLEKFPQWENIYQLVILPYVKEDWSVVKETLDSLKKSGYPKEKMIIVLAREERAGKASEKIAEMARQYCEKSFYRFLVTVHPKGMNGEIIGKGSNVSFAGRGIRKLLEDNKIPFENVLISNFDIDTKVFPQYFLCLTYRYLALGKPQKVSFQPIPVYHNNLWEAPALTRVVAASSSFWQMVQQERPEQLVNYSSHSMPATVFLEVGYPKNIVSDDSHVFWKSTFKFDGEYQVIPLYYPVSMDIVNAPTFWKSLKNQYKQQRRWAWGCVEIPYILFGCLKNKNLPLHKRLVFPLIILEGFWSWACASLLILFLGWLPLILGGSHFNGTVLAWNLPHLTGIIMSFSMVGMVIGALINNFFLPPKPKDIGKLHALSVRVFQWIFLPVTLVFFGSLPALDAQIRLIIGKRLEFWSTPKVRKKYDVGGTGREVQPVYSRYQ